MIKKIGTLIKQNKKVNNKKGAEVIENILMIGIVLSLVVTVFYPEMSNIMSNILTRVSTWFNGFISNLS